MRAHLLDVVQRGQHGSSFGVPAQDQRDEIGYGLGVDGAERLVEQNQRSVLQQQPREQHPLELTAGQRPDRARGEIDQPDCCQRAVTSRRLASSPRQAPISRHSPIATQSNTEIGKLRSISICCGK